MTDPTTLEADPFRELRENDYSEFDILPTPEAKIDALKKALNAADRLWKDMTNGFTEKVRLGDSLTAKLAEREAENARLREGLKPFAEQVETEQVDLSVRHDSVQLRQIINYECPLTVGDLRRARALLNPTEQT